MGARPDFKGDYMGFSFGKKADGTPMHSSDLGIVRTSNGSRFDENLLPTIQDKTVPVPGGDGTYYFGSHYTQRQFSVSFAFDSLTEQEIVNLKKHFGDKQIHDLIFDETPYKVYSAKVTGSAVLKYIPFGTEGERIYKGEGTIQFTCYYPFARCVFSRADITSAISEENYNGYWNWKQYLKKNVYSNIDEWWEASNIDHYKGEDSTFFNFGQVPVPITFIIPQGNSDDDFCGMSWSNFPIEATVDTRTGIVKGVDGKIYNHLVSGNLLYKLPVGEQVPKEHAVNFTCLYI